jgi:hypothetical protein
MTNSNISQVPRIERMLQVRSLDPRVKRLMKIESAARNMSMSQLMSNMWDAYVRVNYDREPVEATG